MPARIPRYSLHKATGHARVCIDGRDHYLGPYGSEESKAEYSRLIVKWQLRRKARGYANLTIGELVLLYDAHVASYYRKNGRATSEVHIVKSALKPLVASYARSAAIDFGPRDLKAVREKYVEQGHSRGTVNAYTRRVVSLFKWAVSEEYAPQDVHAALKTVPGLRAGRTKAPERPPVRPVGATDITATLPLLNRQLRTMVELQVLTGMRPGEVCSVRPCDVERDADVWEYRPASHKLEHHGRSRVVFLGPKAQRVLAPWLDDRPAESPCFSPAEAERQRLALAHAKRRTPLSCGNRPGRSTVERPERAPGEIYTTASYGRAIARACKAAGIAVWSPNQLRHSRATDLRRLFGIEAAGVVLGHSKISTTEHYAERDHAKAREIMATVG